MSRRAWAALLLCACGPSSGTVGATDTDATTSTGSTSSSTTGTTTTGETGSSTGTCRERPFYVDADDDGWGDPDTEMMACEVPPGHSGKGGDCDDTDPEINPGENELCDDIDNDCDGKNNEWSYSNASCDGCEILNADNVAWYWCTLPNPTFDTASQGCAAHGATLASVADEAEDTVLYNFAFQMNKVLGAPPPDAYIGLTDVDQEGTFAWIDGTALTYENWYPDEPNDLAPGQDCVALKWFEGKQNAWFDVGCDDPTGELNITPSGYLCKDPDP